MDASTFDAAAQLGAAHAATAGLPGGSIEGIAVWAADRLATIQSYDPASYDTMRNSMTALLEAFKDVMDAHAGAEVGDHV